LFSIGVGGFYGDKQDKPNRLFFTRNNKAEMYFILEPEFMIDAQQLFNTVAQRPEAIRNWLENPLFLQAPLRVISLATPIFYELRRDVLEQRMHGRSPDQIRLVDIERLMPSEEVSSLKLTPHDTNSDTEMQSVVLMGSNLKIITDCLYHADIPAFYMLTNNRALLKLNGQRFIMPGAVNPINYFLHVPGQALYDGIQLIQRFPVYRNALLRCLQNHLLILNQFATSNNHSEALSTKCRASKETASFLYTLLNCLCVLNYIAMTNSKLSSENSFISLVLGLNDLVSSITREMAAQATDEVRFTATDISGLIERAKEILKLLQERYREGIVLAGQHYTIRGRIAQNYYSLSELHARLLGQQADESRALGAVQAAQMPQASLTTSNIVSNDQKLEGGNQSNSGGMRKPY
jgi:hypothetical protein